MEKIKVIHIITRLDKGGSAENTFLTAKGLNKERYDVILVKGLSLESNMAEDEVRAVEESVKEVEREGVRIITVPGLVRRVHPFCDVRALAALTRILRRERPQIVHTHTSKAGLIGRVAAFMARTPVIIHTPHGHIFYGYFGRVTTCIFVIIERLLAKITDKIITLTNQEGLDHIRFKIASPAKFATIHSGVDIQKFITTKSNVNRLKRSFGIKAEALVVGSVGRLVPIKGHRYLIFAAPKILKEVPEVKFVLVGDGYLRPESERLARTLSVREAFLFLNWRSDIPQIMGMFDLFALPSLNEGMGKVLVEAMAAGKPVVASNTGGIPDLIIDGDNGILVCPEDIDQLSEAIIKLLKDEKIRREMGGRGRVIAKRYSIDSMVKQIDALYVELLDKTGRDNGMLNLNTENS